MPPTISTQGERWLALVFPFEPALRAALSQSPSIQAVPGRSESALDELLCDTYARILTAASEADFMPACLRTFALNIAREVAGIAAEGGPDTEAAELARLAAVVKTLPAVTRQVFTLRKVYECSHDEIATRLQLSVEAVQAHLITAVEACSRALYRSS